MFLDEKIHYGSWMKKFKAIYNNVIQESLKTARRKMEKKLQGRSELVATYCTGQPNTH